VASGRGGSPPVREHPARPGRGTIVPARHVREPAAEHDDIGIRMLMTCASARTASARSARASRSPPRRSRRQKLLGAPLLARRRAVIQLSPGPRNVSMHPLAAVAVRPGRSASVAHGGGLCPHSPACSSVPRDMAVDGDAPAPVPGSRQHHPVSGAGAVDGLETAETVGVVLDPHRPAGRSTRSPRAATVEPGRVRVAEQAVAGEIAPGVATPTLSSGPSQSLSPGWRDEARQVAS
jgi:hypothetical protein